MTSAQRSGLGALVTAILAIGLGTSVAMWCVGFVTHLPIVRLPPWVIAVLLLAAQFLGGIVAGRKAGGLCHLRLGVGSGLLSAAVNLLIVGSVVASDSDSNSLRPGWGLIVGGSLLAGALLGLVGAIIGKSTSRVGSAESIAPARVWLGRFGVASAIAALPVLLSGGLVTSAGAGLAVPDWPTSYNANMFLYPLSKMTGGIYYEHAHRLFGSLVGLTTLILMLATLVIEPRRWVKLTVFVAFLAVCGQGYLGGKRVISADVVGEALSPQMLADNKSSLILAMVHGITGQLFFAMLCVIAAALSVRWIKGPDERPAAVRAPVSLALMLVGALVLQLSFGSAARHLHHPHILWSHVGFAVIVVVLAAMAGFRAISACRDVPAARKLGHAVVHTVGLQAILGLITLLAVLPYQPDKVDGPGAVALATGHQALGAILIGCASMLCAWMIRLRADERGA